MNTKIIFIGSCGTTFGSTIPTFHDRFNSENSEMEQGDAIKYSPV